MLSHAIALSALLSSLALAQDTADTARAAPAQATRCKGETATYDVRFGVLRVGSATVTVEPDTSDDKGLCRGVVAIRGGVLFVRVNDRYESLFDPQTAISRRYQQSIHEGGYRRERAYDLSVPGHYVIGNDTGKSVPEPVDDVSLLFLLRRIPLVVGERLEASRYFIADRNPLIVNVQARETIRVPAGEFSTIKLRPTVKARGIFAEGGNAELWVADDSSRVLVQLKTSLQFGSLNLYLRSYTRSN